METDKLAGADGLLLVFAVAGEFCAVPAGSVQEIVPMATLARVPGQPPLLEGFLNLRGTPVPVLRLRRLLSLPPAEPGLHTPIIILRNQASPAGLLVDEVIDITGFENSRPVPENGSFNDCAQALVEAGGRTVHLLSPERLLLERERQCVAELREQAQRRLDELEARPA
jgi:purine-binding chemotaxis protein CheW